MFTIAESLLFMGQIMDWIRIMSTNTENQSVTLRFYKPICSA